MSEIIVLKAVYDNSDFYTDYYCPSQCLNEWFICEMEGKRRTEGKLWKALKLLPEWLKRLTWEYYKGEKFVGARFFYPTLSAKEDLGLKVKNDWGYTVRVRLHITFSSRYWFEANHGINAKIPQSLEEFKQFIEDWIRRREEKRRQTKEKVAEAMIKTIESSHAIIDGRGFIS